MDNIPDDLRQLVAGILGMFPTAFLARFLLHHQLVRAGHRRFWSRELLWELPMAVLCAIVGGGAAAILEVEGMAAHAVVGAVAWLGPRGLEVMLTRWAARYSPGGGGLRDGKDAGKE